MILAIKVLFKKINHFIEFLICFYKDHLKQKLDDYVKRWNGKVVVYHTEKRLGLVQARQYGAEKIKGDVIVILDAHCECSTNWLPPLLARIKLNRFLINTTID
jgi:polypeptide N-acetylgalactosaminyltransferase